MQFNKQQTHDSYLRDTIIEGIKPFLYRSSLCSLLGFPDIYAGRLTFQPPLPPVGFRFLNHQLTGEPLYITHYPLSEGGPFATYNVLGSELNGSQRLYQEKIQSNEHIEKINREAPNTYESPPYSILGRKMSRNKILGKETVQQDGAIHELKHEVEAPDESYRHLEKPVKDIKRVNMEIPGTSERALKSPNIGIKASSEMDPYHSGDRDMSLSKGISRNKILGKETIQQDGAIHELKHEVEAPDESYRSTEKAGEDIKRVDMEILGTSERSLKGPNIGIQPSSIKSQYLKGNDTLSKNNKERDQNNTVLAGMGEGIVRKSLFGDQSGEPRINSMKTSALTQQKLQKKHSNQQLDTKEGENNTPFIPFQPIGINPVYVSSQSRSDRIEQLRYAVQELASKVSSKQAKTNEETKQLHKTGQPLPMPPQRVVIIKGTSPRGRPPCAFWERSYLGRFHLWTLR